MSDCLFCKIIKGEIPSTKVFENDSVYAFEDINPMAKGHILFIHKNHSADINEISSSNLVDIFQAITLYTKENSIEDDGFRVVTNLGKDAGQTVFHTHFHLLFGEPLGRFGK